LIPLVDINAQYLGIKSEIDSAISEVILSGDFIKGKAVNNFEKAFADYLGARFCLGVGNGTDALEIILKSLNIGIGDEVLVPALTWIATAEAVNNVGGEPVFVDINPATYTIDIKKIEEKITSRTKAIIPVHLYGCPSDMNEIIKIANNYKLYVVEDCAQSHGAEYLNKKTGTFGIASAFSFFPSKNLSTFGDGGAIITSDPELFEKACRIANHGQLKVKHEHTIIGRNSRLDTIHAAVLNVKLKHLDVWNASRIAAAAYYKSMLNHINDLILPETPPGYKHVFHLFVIRTKHRDLYMKTLKERNIACAIHYPRALPFTNAYSYSLTYPDQFPVSKIITDEILSLPLYPEIEQSQIDEVCIQLSSKFKI